MASNNTSKTAHVMNLLSKNRSAEPAESKTEQMAEAAAEPAAEAAPAAPERTAPVAPIISSITADAAVSTQIKDALEAELEGLASAPEAPPPAAGAPAIDAPSVPEAPPSAAAAPAPDYAPAQADLEDPEDIPMDLPLSPERPTEEAFAYINVMQTLVEEKADEYMKMFGICCCDKCRVDVRAFALNHLPPKYVVLSERDRIPRLTVYESRFSSDITAQLIQACKQVMLTPHHSRPKG